VEEQESFRARPGITSALVGSLSFRNLLISFGGLCLMAFCFTVFNALMSMVPAAASFGLFSNPFMVMMSFCIYLFTVTALAEGRNLPDAMFFSLRRWIPILCASAFAAASIYGGFALFNMIPALQPAYFAPLFVPVYTLLLAGVFFATAAFWFYGPFVARLEAPAMGGFFYFSGYLWRRGLQLAAGGLLLAGICGFAGTLLGLAHYGFTRLLMALWQLAGGSGYLVFHSGMEGLRSVMNFTYIGRNIIFFRDIISGTGTMSGAGGPFIGAPYILATLLYFAALLSFAARLSFYASGVIESGFASGERKRLFFILPFFVIAAVLWALKRLYW
jgi:hypothetical protein